MYNLTPLSAEEEARKVKSLESLPWESDDESKAIISEALMADILQLALSESNFTEPPPAKIIECCNFDLQLFISQAMRLLSLDQNLAHIHAKISPKMDEESFWRNYFARIFYLRCKSGLLDRNDAIVQTVSSFAESDVIHQAGAVLGSAHASISVHSEGEISSPVFSHLSSSTEQGAVGEGKKPSAWESSSSEDISSSDMSTSSYEVLSSGHVGGSKIHAKAKVSDEEALFEAQVHPVLVSTLSTYTANFNFCVLFFFFS